MVDLHRGVHKEQHVDHRNAHPLQQMSRRRYSSNKRENRAVLTEQLDSGKINASKMTVIVGVCTSGSEHGFQANRSILLTKQLSQRR